MNRRNWLKTLSAICLTPVLPALTVSSSPKIPTEGLVSAITFNKTGTYVYVDGVVSVFYDRSFGIGEMMDLFRRGPGFILPGGKVIT